VNCGVIAGLLRPQLQGTIAFVAIGDGLALDAERTKVALTDRRRTASMKFVAHWAVGLIVEYQFVDVFGAGRMKIRNL
jgi:hypothetical protein